MLNILLALNRFTQCNGKAMLMLTSALLMLACNPAYAGKGMVEIITDPGKAKLYINGKRKGTSTATKGQTFTIKLPEGEYIIKAVIERGLYHLIGQEEVFVAEDTLQTVDIKVSQKSLSAAGKAISSIQKSMLTIPAGSFHMGCVTGKDCDDNEKPVHKVQVPAFALQSTEVTFAQWDACVTYGPCHSPEDQGWGRGQRPVANVSWHDAQVFIRWLNSLSVGGYRLPSEAEWEYAARAGSNIKYSWGNSIGSNKANCYGCGSAWDNEKTAPVGSFAANAFGLYDMHGNVWEWVQDCWNDSYQGAPADGSAWLYGDCGHRVGRGGSLYNEPLYLRAANRGRYFTGYRYYYRGFRLAQDL